MSPACGWSGPQCTPRNFLVLGFQYKVRCRPFPGTSRGTAEEIRAGAPPGKDAPDRVRTVCIQNRKKRGEGKPETFDFLGLTHISGKSQKGKFVLKRKTIIKRMRGKLQAIKQELRRRMHDPVKQTGEWLQMVVQGYLTTTRYLETFNGCTFFAKE